MTTVRGFAFDGANEFQEEADLDFPASLDDGGLVWAREFALVFHAAELPSTIRWCFVYRQLPSFSRPW